MRNFRIMFGTGLWQNFRDILQREWIRNLTKKDWFFGTDNNDLDYVIRESNIYLGQLLT